MVAATRSQEVVEDVDQSPKTLSHSYRSPGLSYLTYTREWKQGGPVEACFTLILQT